MSKFELGQLVATCGVDRKMKRDEDFRQFVQKSLLAYISGDWGDTCEEDAILNNEAVKDGERILAVYIHKPSDTKIWIITEWDRSVTTILFPSEY